MPGPLSSLEVRTAWQNW